MEGGLAQVQSRVPQSNNVHREIVSQIVIGSDWVTQVNSMHPRVGDIHSPLGRQFPGLAADLGLPGENAVGVHQGGRVQEFCQAGNPNLLQIQRAVKRRGSRIVLHNRPAFALQPNLLRSLPRQVGRRVESKWPIGRKILQRDIDVVIHSSRLLRRHVGEGKLSIV